MALTYNPKDAATAWPEGEYDAVLKDVQETVSKSRGQPMEVWTFDVFDGDRTQSIKEYVVVPAAVFKIKQLAEALGKRADFEAGTFQAENELGSSVVVELKIECQDGYDDKNRINRTKPAAKPAGKPAADRPTGEALRDAKVAAWNAFKKLFPDDTRNAWNAAVKKYFDTKPPDTLGIVQWETFAADGFKKPAAKSPLSDKKEFSDTDDPNSPDYVPF